MPNNTLVIIDLNKNYDLIEKKVDYVCLNKGLINLKNCKQIYLRKFNKEKKNIYKKILSKLLKIIFKNKNNDIPMIELEINNLRNDRYNFIDRIINLIILKKIILLSSFNNIKIISDNQNTLNIFDKLKIKIEKIDLSKNEQKVFFFKLKLLKFYVKSLLVIILLKFKKKDKIIKKNSEFFFSIYPNKFDYYKKKLDKEFTFNFLLTDETHLNHNIFQIYEIIKNQKNKKYINLESFISIRYLLGLILKTLFIRKKNKLKIKNFNIDNLEFHNEIKQFYTKSFLNRLKLSIYDDAIFLFLKKFDIKIIHMYLFEYSFGFYLINKIRSFSKKIKILGYQHGIFSENLCWLDILRLVKGKKNYLPNKILASNNFSEKDYKNKLGEIDVGTLKKFQYKRNILSNEIKINKNSNNTIVFPGTHDISDLYYFFKNSQTLDKKRIFFKLHPKNKFLFKNTNNIKIITNHKIKYFSEIIISQTSSLIYDFLRIKKKFSVISLDYKSDLISKRILQKIKPISKDKDIV